MGQETYREFAQLIEPAIERPFPKTFKSICENEAHYCRARAEEELSRAREAWHPAARAAHLEMAALYRDRSLASE